MSQILRTAAVIGIDIGKNSFHVVGLDGDGAIVLRQKWSRGQVEARLANMPPCLIGMEACVGAHHLSRKLKALGHDAGLMPAKYVWPYSKGQKNDFRDAEAIAEAVQRPTMKFVATKTADRSLSEMNSRSSEVRSYPNIRYRQSRSSPPQSKRRRYDLEVLLSKRPSPSLCRKIAFGFLEKNRRRCGAIFLARSQRRYRISMVIVGGHADGRS
jgi:hypothetical protein